MSRDATLTGQRKVAGRYKLVAELGRGGTAIVYRAEDESLGRTVALKRLVNATSVTAALFEDEYYGLAGLKHRAIIEVFDYGVDGEGPYYTMELLDGGDVAGKTPMPWREVCQCLRDVGGALALVHRREFVHRDISPRNIWRTANGTFKVLDFGALTPFDKPKNIVGTPAFMAPEVAAWASLDQRADLYSLGAVAYFLLTGSPPHPVRTVQDVRVQRPAPPPPSEVAAERDARAELAGESSEEAEHSRIPDELDELVLQLLSRNPLARPFSAAEVIERAAAIAGLSHEESRPSNAPRLISATFVGRDGEAKILEEAIADLTRRRGRTLLVEGAPGQGKTRLLGEAQVAARIAGIAVISVEARLHQGFHGGAVQLAESLLEVLPEVSRELAGSHAAMLAHLGASLADKLGQTKAKLPEPIAPGELRALLQDALFAWFKAVSGRRPLAIFVDDADELDDASAGFLAGLARVARTSAMLIVASQTKETDRATTDAMKVLQSAAERLPLRELPIAALRSLVRSAFGDVPGLPRLAEKLHERSHGNPQHCMDLIRHLVETDVIHHEGGTWLLPVELRNDQLPDTFEVVLARRFERLSPVARDVARVALLYNGPLSARAVRGILPEEDPGSVLSAVDELLREGVVTGSRRTFRMAARYAAHAGELAPRRATLIHRRLAEAILARAPRRPADLVEAGMHLVHAGDDDRGRPLVARGGMDMLAQTHALPLVTPLLEVALDRYKREGRPAAELAPILGPLALASFHSDHRLASRYGDEALDLFRKLIGITFASRLRPYLGRHLSMLIALMFSAMRLKRSAKSGRAPTLKEAITMFSAAVGALTAVYVVYTDRARALRTADVIEPLTILGKNHAVSVIHEFARNVAMTVDNSSGRARAALRQMLGRLRSDRPIRDLSPIRRRLCLAGSLYALGILEAWRDGPEALRFADELDSLEMKLFQMSADQVRALYYANQGNTERSEYYRERVETYAIQRGTAWQAEIWWYGALTLTQLRAQDAMGMKHTRDVLERLAQEIPTLALHAQRARGAYLVMRGRYREAIALLEQTNVGEHRFVVGANPTVAILARAYGLSGNPAHARALCENAIAQMSEGDRELVAINHFVFTELALAEARLGNFDAAEKSLDALIEHNLPLEGPLTLGALYETLGAVFLLKKDVARARTAFERMTAWYSKTRLPPLAARSEALMASVESGRGSPSIRPSLEDDVSNTISLIEDSTTRS
ncbi:MAG TPA: AAA family ATPase [Polyangiaceae bacterium]|nr:AAA family ATPase [Polyangiaceae bacterium]